MADLRDVIYHHCSWDSPWPSMAIHGHPWPMMAVWDSHGVMVFPGIPTHRVPPASAATPKTYFAPPGQWTSDLANAQTYPNMTTFIWAPGLRALSFSTRSLLCPVWMSNSYLLLLNAAKHYLHIYIYIIFDMFYHNFHLAQPSAALTMAAQHDQMPHYEFPWCGRIHFGRCGLCNPQRQHVQRMYRFHQPEHS